MVQKIHKHGYWLMNNNLEHQFDKELCRAIVYMAKVWKIKTIIDIGCGDGSYTKYLMNCGFDCRGYDGNPYTKELTNAICHVKDFSIPVDVNHYDLVLCLEVGEHIPEKYENGFFRNVINAAKKRIILSWAVEGQAGFGHVNNRNNDYIINKMQVYRFIYDDGASKLLRAYSTKSWFKNTLMVFHLD